MGQSALALAEVQVRLRRGRATLVLVLGAELAGAVRGLGRGAHLEQGELADLHAGPEGDGQVGHVGKFQGDVAGEARVDESGGGVGQQAQAAEGGFAFEAAGEVVGKREVL